MQQTWRWFGPDDPVSLTNIVQAGASGVVTSLHHIPTGEAWPLADICERKMMIEDHGLEWSVVESIPVHNDLKTRSGDYRRLLDNYKASVHNVGTAGVPVVCYNFMPVVDWTRTNLDYALPNASRALRFEMTDFVAYDVFILQREGAASDYSDDVLAAAEARHAAMADAEKDLLEKNIIAGLPGGEGSYDRAGIREAIEDFIKLGESGLRRNLFNFLALMVDKDSGNLKIDWDDEVMISSSQSIFRLPLSLSTISARKLNRLRA